MSEDEVDSGYTFDSLRRALDPPNVQYTPEYDEHWIHPTGSKAAGTVDSLPVQGLELTVVGTRDTLEQDVRAVLIGLERFYKQYGHYPKHRIIADEDAFETTVEGNAGQVAVIQPPTGSYEDLTAHFREMQQEPTVESVRAPNFEPAIRATVSLASAFADDGRTVLDSRYDPHIQSIHRSHDQIAKLPVFERYTALGANEMYDVADGTIDFDDPDATTAADLSFAPAYLGISDWCELHPLSWFVATASEPKGVVARTGF